MKKLIQLILLLMFTTTVSAQETCIEKLYRANLLYEKGKITEAIELAKTCVENNNTKENWQANRLLAMCYLVNKQELEARKSARKMMEINPTYKPSALQDPVDLIRLLKSIKVVPKFTLGIASSIGGNITYPNIKGSFNGADYTKTYTSGGGWQLAALMGYNLNENISLNTGLLNATKSYTINYQVSDWNIEVKERLSYIDLPLFARFVSLPRHNLRVFADAGAYAGRLINSSSDFSRKNASNNEQFEDVKLNSEDRKNNWEYGLLYGAGVMYDLGKMNIAVDIRYYLSYANITNEENRYENDKLFYDYYYIDDNLRLNNLAISLSLIYNVNYRVAK